MMLEVENLSVAYKGIHAVNGISFTVPAGGITCMIGRNGAGKSSTVGAIAGFVKASGGRVVLDGRDLTHTSTAGRSRAGVALVPENRRIFGTLTAAENVMLGAPSSRGDAQARFAEILELFPAIRTFQGRGGHQLSGGEQQMVAISRALMCSPKVLILDEPSLGLAPIVVKAVFAAIEELASAGQAILLIEQNGRAALRISQRAYAMSLGQVHELDHRSAGFDERELHALYL
ncbi:ABC transporter ATP-binding protein [Amycolatopsis sp. K13G38]|uniref:ABC transporter ATP-binding protein n=1 Tax=Amycolatopsis acididurans TaxID=2724524 RepID=A0ABX1J906_9PSEU|nr:ABC transporter ATP-binding protein [Amycolatopsis acididurans]NKQ56159.1 ABC transporter ATP-binding protein [Amycolatopsis acididurans]